MLGSRQSFETKAKLAALDRVQAVIEFDLDGTILTANENFLGAVGYSLAEIVGKHHSMFVEPAYKESAEYRDFWASLRTGQYEAAEYKRFGKGGREIWIQASYNPLMHRDGKPYKVIKFATDITKRRQEDADRVGQTRGDPQGAGRDRIHPRWRHPRRERELLRRDGLCSSPRSRASITRCSCRRPSASSGEYGAFWASLKRGEYQAAQYKRYGKAGKEIWIQASYNPIFDASGRPYKVVKFATDITEQVKLAQQSEPHHRSQLRRDRPGGGRSPPTSPAVRSARRAPPPRTCSRWPPPPRNCPRRSAKSPRAWRARAP